ncbi:MAG: efflux RND transporter periplasmic adaptor subunit [Acidobacteriota bacterium]
MKRLLLIVVLIAVAGGFGAYRYTRQGADGEASRFRTAPVKRGDLTVAISATGTVEPEEVVDVGAQVAGRILSFGKDQAGKTVDYGSAVEQGTVLAQIDDAVYSSDVAQMKAQLDTAKAGVTRAEADLGQLQARLAQAERDWARAKKLGPSEALARSDYDAAQSAFEIAKANVDVGKASLAQAKNGVSQSEAAFKKAQNNLDYCTIKSPVRGVIIDRRVNIGQTVVASLNAPSLFLIAKDLKRLQVWVAVNEADIGNIHPGQAVSFTVDAFPGEMFQGEVGKVRLNASMTQNVVTYTVEVVTDNSSGKLLPYLTANVKFLLDQRKDVLQVSNAALRWNPQPEQIVPEKRPAPAAEGAPNRESQRRASEGAPPSAKPVLWVVDGGFVRPVPVVTGLSDGSMTEIQSEEIKEGTEVVVGERSKEASAAPSSGGSPFMPRPFSGGRGPR